MSKKTTSPVSAPFSIGTVLFAEADLRPRAKNLQFTQRTLRKIEVVALLASVCAECVQGSPSGHDLAAQIQTLSGHAPSRQAVSLRLNQALANLLQQRLEKVLGQKVAGAPLPPANPMAAFRHHRRVLVQDSTIIQLPRHPFGDFSGVANAHTSVCNARIQATYNLLTRLLHRS